MGLTDHLLPSVAKIALLEDKEQKIIKLRGDYWIEYSRAQKILNRLEELLIFPKKIRMPNMLIISPSNNGKTMIVEKFRRSHLPYDSENGENQTIPVLMVQMPSNPTAKRFYASILMSLGSPITVYPSTANNEMMALKLLRITKTRILIIDELHNILAGNISKQREFLNILRFIGNELQLSIVGVGIKDAYLAIRSDDQLENRFEPCILPLWQNDNEYIKLLASFIKVLPLRKLSPLLNHDISTMILERSEGIIGEIAALLTQAAAEVIRSGKEYIDLETLEQINYRSPTERRRLYESMVY